MNPISTVGEKAKGFAVGLSVTASTALYSLVSSAPQATQTAQSLCTTNCSACYACGIGAVPLLLFMAKKHRKKALAATGLLAAAGGLLAVEVWGLL